MSRRIEVELTSVREDGRWTWRAAGAKQPKGELDGGLLPGGSKVGDVVRADADFEVDGIFITSVIAPKAARKEPELLELIGRPQGELVTTQLAPKGRGGGRRDGRGGGRGGRDGRDRGDRGDRGDRSDRSDRGDRGRGGGRGPREDSRPDRPRPKRLRPGRTHRQALLAGAPEEQKAVLEQLIAGGLPAVREAIEKQNESVAEGQPPINAEPLLALADSLASKVQVAEWRDRADAALKDIAELDLRDLRSVVVAADGGARDDEGRQVAEQLRTGLNERVEAEHKAWIADLEAALKDGRSVRALRLSSRPPKAGTPLPPELATKLTEAAAASFEEEITEDRFATVLDALAYSPVRSVVTPANLPSEPSDDLKEAITRLSTRVPHIAAMFGIEPTEVRSRGRKGRGGRTGADRAKGGKGAPKVGDKAPAVKAAVAEAAVAEATTEAAVAEATAEATTEAAVAEATAEATTEAAVAEAAVAEATTEAAVAEAAVAEATTEAAVAEATTEATTEAAVAEATTEAAVAEATTEADES
ncbi:MAG: hypothetical protein GY929_06265 [Actinomycetia bacterium]|nr:hypothetical protein [Actinomycetes bacterium]